MSTIEQTVCIIQPSESAYSETFLQAHAQRLPASVKVLYGRGFPRYSANDRPFSPLTLLPHLVQDPFCKKLNLPDYYFYQLALRRFLRREKIAAVLAEYALTGVAVMDACSATGVPLIVHFHGYDAYRQDVLQKEGKRYPEMFEKSAAIVAVSRHMEKQLLALGVPQNKLHYNSCGVDISQFQGAVPDQAPPLFVTVGRFVDKKAPYLTLLAFREVLNSEPSARLVMIGNGPLLESCRGLARALNMDSSVSFPGVLGHDEVAAWMCKARGFLQHSVKTSLGDMEGTPVALLEACGAGLPSVATRHGGITDVVIDGQTGFLVDEGDVSEMAKNILRLIHSPALATSLGKAARHRVSDLFSMDRSINRLWQIICATIVQKNSNKIE